MHTKNRPFGPRLRLWGAMGVFAASTLASSSAAAFCRTTTCDPNLSCSTYPEDCCILDRKGCDTNGIPISWPSACVSYNVQEDGSPLLGISSAELSRSLGEAFGRWMGVECMDDTGLSLTMENRGTAECANPEFNEGAKDRNANIWMFNDEVMGDLSGRVNIDVTTLAVTLVSFNFKTAEIYDVDVELNSGLADFTVSDFDVHIDLDSVVTHEAGHFLGLDHSLEPGATMASGYTPGDIQPRTLAPDDEHGICAVYPEDRTITRDTCEPRGKYHTKCEGQGCDCRMSPGRGSSPRGAWLGAALGLLFVWRRRARAGSLSAVPLSER